MLSYTRMTLKILRKLYKGFNKILCIFIIDNVIKTDYNINIVIDNDDYNKGVTK